jgi:N-terminal domain of galactosyltransferase
VTILTRQLADPVTTISAAATTYLDDSSQEVSATCWRSSNELNHAAFLAVASSADLTESDEVDLRREASNAPSHVFDKLRATLDSSGVVTSALQALADRIASQTRLIFYRSDAASDRASVSQLNIQQRPIDIIIPFRTSDLTPLRTANLTAVVEALSHQSIDRGLYGITVVEESSNSRVPAAVFESVDKHLQIPNDGPFNKALAINSAVSESVADLDTVLCLLDGDIFPDEEFVARNARRVHYAPTATHLPYSDMFCICAADSEDIRANGVVAARPRDGYVITHPPGGCVVMTREVFENAEGFDANFEGWGGEDRDFIDRASAVSRIDRHDELLIHLNHERPNMPSDRQAIMQRAGKTLQSESR